MSEERKHAIRSLLLAVVFAFFFDRTKHQPVLASVNPFGEDPYDAIGSISVQLVGFLALLSLLRAFRPATTGAISAETRWLNARTRLLGAAAISVTMIGDVVAMARHLTVWYGSYGGFWLAVATILMLLAGIHELFTSGRRFQIEERAQGRHTIIWQPAVFSVCLMVLALALYPERLRINLAGHLATALAGMVLLYLPLAAVAYGMQPHPVPSIDVVDDVVAGFGWIKSRVPQLRPVHSYFSQLQRHTLAGRTFDWINPRRHRWRLSVVLGAALGLLLVAFELGFEPPSNLRLATLLVAVFLGLESFAVLTGYAVLARPLGLFRADQR